MGVSGSIDGKELWFECGGNNGGLNTVVGGSFNQKLREHQIHYWDVCGGLNAPAKQTTVQTNQSGKLLRSGKLPVMQTIEVRQKKSGKLPVKQTIQLRQKNQAN